MSSRALRRLEKQNQIDNADAEEERIELVKPAKPAFNAFALLDEADESDDSNPSDESPREEEKVISKVTTPPQKPTKNRKGKSKKPAVVQPSIDSDEDLDRILAEARQKDQAESRRGNASKPLQSAFSGALDEIGAFDFEEELDMHVQPVAQYDANFIFFTSNRLKQSLPLLSIKTLKNLDPDQEFRNLFGNLSLDVIEDANTTASFGISPEMLTQFKKLARLTRGWGGKDRRSVPGTTRKLLMTRIRDDWLPTAVKGLSMDEIRPENLIDYYLYKADQFGDVALESSDWELKIAKEREIGVRYFRFEKAMSVQERVANTKFYAAVVMTPDHESLMNLLQQYPYHVETLLQVAMVLLRQGENKSTSNSLIEKALFVFDRAFHKTFHELMFSGKNELVRLPYEQFANRQFYICLFRIIAGLGERRTFTTALNYCKLLLSLAPAQDPVGVRYFIDHYAIMSEEYSYLINLAQSPLCTTYSLWFTPGIAYSSVFAHLCLKNEQGAKKALAAAFKAHPHTGARLLEMAGAPLPAITNPTSPRIKIETETYMVRAAASWSAPDKQNFLRKELSRLFQEANADQKPSIFAPLRNLFGKPPVDEDSDIPHNLIRFAVLSGEAKIMSKLPESIWDRDDMFEYDVLPPVDLHVDYDEYTGITRSDTAKSVVTSLIRYVDHNLLGAIVQSRTAAGHELDELIGQGLLQADGQDAIQVDGQVDGQED